MPVTSWLRCWCGLRFAPGTGDAMFCSVICATRYAQRLRCPCGVVFEARLGWGLYHARDCQAIPRRSGDAETNRPAAFRSVGNEESPGAATSGDRAAGMAA